VAILFSAHSQEAIELDYIKSGYYQLIHEADIASLEGNEDLAFEKLAEAEKRCPMINQPLYYEMQKYSALLMKRKQFDKALYYMDKLSAEYGTFDNKAYRVLEKDSLLMNELLLEYPNFIDSVVPAMKQKAADFFTPERQAVIEELIAIRNKDQGVRKDKTRSEEAYQKMQEVDQENAEQLLAIMQKHGYPNTRLYGQENHRWVAGVEVVFIHNYENEILRELLLEYVRKGEASPDQYGFMIDRERLDMQTPYVYAIYNNITDDQIEDIEHVDERRLSIGMPTREMERRRNELIEPQIQNLKH
jgi:hypothetical protein